MATPTTVPTRVVPPCALCNVNGHATNKFPTLPELRNLLNPLVAASVESIPVVEVTLSGSSKDTIRKHNPSLRTNHPYTLCNLHSAFIEVFLERQKRFHFGHFPPPI